ncbi:UbiA-like protein EboC [Synechocystis sp. PCC 7509]|uniref:UbiA-like protein EboC n=1 Tax=Synechocystis sp. PCC 7509 TaxID=927677 RepID=UPI0002AC3789|nr:UbiA-like protein EboC [Synechocystis sp. PCC 7509]
MTTVLKPNYRLNTRIWAYLQLMRPANIVTAWADILTGFAASGAAIDTPLAWLILATTGLYGGGVVFNDVFDAQLDAIERPERPIPTGKASVFGATILGVVLLTIGIVAAAQVSLISAVIAAFVAMGALIYDAWNKHNAIASPINMGLCRGGNLLLGVSATPAMVGELWFLALIPIFYIAAVTAISRGEVHGGKSSTGKLALLLLAIALCGVLALGLLPNYFILAVLPFLALLTVRVFPPFIAATYNPSADIIRKAVKAGVLSLIILDASMAAGFAGFVYGLLVLGLSFGSIALAKVFAVT